MATFTKSREHHKFCCQSCRVEAWNDRKSGGSRVVELEMRVAELEASVENLFVDITELQGK